MNKKILVSLTVIAIVAAIGIGGTIAYFSDTETSTGNTFTAGSIDLTVDNTCYYNEIACIEYDASDVYYWDTDKNGTIECAEIYENNICVCTWDLDNLTGKVFFNFADLKPGDHGEDTISLHVTSNDAWSCAKIELTANDDMTCTEPELNGGDGTCVEGGSLFDGELAQNLEFIWWADDGDNVLEEGELVVVHDGAPASATTNPVGGVLLSTIVGAPTTWTRNLTTADNTFNMFKAPYTGAPLDADTPYYIGKAWCFGELTITPLTPGSYNPTTANNITCSGANVTNVSQTDKVEGTLEFYAEQSRNNTNFLCPEHTSNSGS